MRIEGYQFSEICTDLSEISSIDVGVYVVLCLISERPHCVLYIGTSEGGTRADVTPTGNLQYTLSTHEKRRCWEDNVHEEIGYCVKHVTDVERRIDIRDELQWKYTTPCGVDPWDAPQTGDE
ncbi:hypothetical protein GCM10009037_01170 [Halarchaeum grantii]|uniref:GIY-YIG domain-containing protein n=1 Tax=Halarchaeum grantii TaxID=1193105 RepID=A0A830EXZ6_9EURY|nr:hypothetical protein [Halarchaeum grantii]GGL21631.1 hypothetical protein GCM10009037_01170 [Halarchaeum grantii]